MRIPEKPAGRSATQPPTGIISVSTKGPDPHPLWRAGGCTHSGQKVCCIAWISRRGKRFGVWIFVRSFGRLKAFSELLAHRSCKEVPCS